MFKEFDNRRPVLTWSDVFVLGLGVSSRNSSDREIIAKDKHLR